MSQLFEIHPDNPQARLLRQAVVIIKQGGLVVFPTDSGYALGCQLGDKAALTRIRQLRQLDESHNMTLVCRDLSELATYAKVDNATYRLLKANTPGPYTFILPATSEVPRRFLHPKRRTIGVRVPDNAIALALLETLEEPLMSTTLILPGAESPLMEPDAINDLLGPHIDLIVGGGHCGMEPTTVIDFVSGEAKIIRQGKGKTTPFVD